jgi:hypothetical protein
MLPPFYSAILHDQVEHLSECGYANIHSTDELVVLIVIKGSVDFSNLGELGWMERDPPPARWSWKGG